MTDTDRVLEAELRFLRHVIAMGGWLTNRDTLFDEGERQIRDQMLVDGRLECDAVNAGRTRIVRITETGRTWLAGQEA